MIQCKRHITVLWIFLLIGMLAKAQTNPCATNLKDANDKYEQGWYDEAIALVLVTLENCKLSDNDRIEANKLLIISYLSIDKIEEAEAAAATIMKIDPNYEPDRLRDPAEVIVIFEKYRPEIVLKGLVGGGINFSQTSASNTYSIVNDNDSEGLDNYENLTGFQIGVGLEYRVLPSFWIQAAVQFRKSGYSIQISNVQDRTISYQEELNYFDLPLSAKYYFGKSKFQPYAQAGVNLAFLNSALGEISRDDISDIVDRRAQRYAFYLGYFGGVGVAYNFKSFSLQAGLSYLYTPENLNKEGTRYDNLDVVFKYYYLDNDFSMNNMLISVGFTYALGYKNVISTENK